MPIGALYICSAIGAIQKTRDSSAVVVGSPERGVWAVGAVRSGRFESVAGLCAYRDERTIAPWLITVPADR